MNLDQLLVLSRIVLCADANARLNSPFDRKHVLSLHFDGVTLDYHYPFIVEKLHLLSVISLSLIMGIKACVIWITLKDDAKRIFRFAFVWQNVFKNKC